MLHPEALQRGASRRTQAIRRVGGDASRGESIGRREPVVSRETSAPECAAWSAAVLRHGAGEGRTLHQSPRQHSVARAELRRFRLRVASAAAHTRSGLNSARRRVVNNVPQPARVSSTVARIAPGGMRRGRELTPKDGLIRRSRRPLREQPRSVVAPPSQPAPQNSRDGAVEYSIAPECPAFGRVLHGGSNGANRRPDDRRRIAVEPTTDRHAPRRGGDARAAFLSPCRRSGPGRGIKRPGDGSRLSSAPLPTVRTTMAMTSVVGHAGPRCRWIRSAGRRDTALRREVRSPGRPSRTQANPAAGAEDGSETTVSPEFCATGAGVGSPLAPQSFT